MQLCDASDEIEEEEMALCTNHLTSSVPEYEME